MSFDRRAIYTYADGTPIEGRPDGDPPDGDIEERIAWMRAWNAYRDRVADVTNRVFIEQFKKSLKATATEAAP
jgi:hypothetical protein